MDQQLPPASPPRRSRARWLIPLAIVALFFGFCCIVVLVAIVAALSVEPITDGTVLEVRLEGELGDAPDPLTGLLPGLTGPPSLYEIREALLRAAEDEKVAAVKVDITTLTLGWGGAEELRSALDTFREAGKPVHAYLRGDLVSDLDYAVALGATKIWLAPQTAVFVNGLRAEVEFWRGTLDKLHVVPQYFMMKEYKSAGEIYSRYEMSEYFREATLAVIEDIWESFVNEFASRRRLDPAAIRATTDRGVMTASEAEAAGWVDAIGYEEDLQGELSTGGGAYHAVSVRHYLDATKKTSHTGSKKIAVVFGEGEIVAATVTAPFSSLFYGPQVAAAIRRAADDDDVAAILFRVDSPGGSAVGSDHVWRAVDYARHERSKPVIVSMGSVAGSGGYWVSMGADAIVARPSTVTGSIGVVFGKLNVTGLYELVGGHVDTVQVGENADMLSFVASLSDAQAQRIRSWMTAVYEDFKAKVASERKLEPDEVERIARGRIWSGTHALANGLVDRLGGYDEAIALARDKAGIPPSEAVRLEVYPKTKSFFEVLFSEDSLVRLRSLVERRDPAAALEQVVRELDRPGVWALAPTLRIE